MNALGDLDDSDNTKNDTKSKDILSIVWHIIALLIAVTALIISIVALLKVPTVKLHPETIDKLNAVLASNPKLTQALSSQTTVATDH